MEFLKNTILKLTNIITMFYIIFVITIFVMNHFEIDYIGVVERLGLPMEFYGYSLISVSAYRLIQSVIVFVITKYEVRSSSLFRNFMLAMNSVSTVLEVLKESEDNHSGKISDLEKSVKHIIEFEKILAEKNKYSELIPNEVKNSFDMWLKNVKGDGDV